MAQVKGKKPQTSRTGNFAIIAIILLVITVVLFYANNDTDEIHNYNYTEFVTELNSGNVKLMQTKPVSGDINFGSYDVSGELKNGDLFTAVIPNDIELSKVILNLPADVAYTPLKGDTYTFISVLTILVPIIIVIALFMFLMRNNQGNNKAFDFGKSRAKLNRGKIQWKEKDIDVVFMGDYSERRKPYYEEIKKKYKTCIITGNNNYSEMFNLICKL